MTSGQTVEVADVPEEWEVTATTEHFRGRVVTMLTDAVRMPGDVVADRDYVRHIGSVAVLALDDEQRVLLLRQYRHPVRHQLWELPAGVRDMDGEPTVVTAARELAEEAAHRATTWHTLLDIMSSPGMSDERIRIFLARGVSEIPERERDYVHHHEEIGMPVVWVPLAEAVRKVLAGEIHNSPAVAGILAAYVCAADGFASLRPPDAPEA